jgi:hypothetical protein
MDLPNWAHWHHPRDQTGGKSSTINPIICLQNGKGSSSKELSCTEKIQLQTGKGNQGTETLTAWVPVWAQTTKNTANNFPVPPTMDTNGAITNQLVQMATKGDHGKR